jgi:3-oxoacyl-[acyl-carrier protein] reductase
MGHPENPVSQGVREIFFFTAGLNEQSSMVMDLGLSAKKGIVCAASKGLGRAVAVALAREGVDLVINARSEDALEGTAESIRAETGVDVIPIAADITTEAGRAAVVAACPDADILINNAGGPQPGDFRQVTREEWIRAIDANMLTPIFLIRAVLDGMIARGSAESSTSPRAESSPPARIPRWEYQSASAQD